MKTVQIFYYQTDGYNPSYAERISSPLSIEGVGFEPVSSFVESDKSSIYYNCPAWSHKAKRTFIIKSPVDLNIEINKKEKSIFVNNITQDKFDRWFKNIFFDNWCQDKKITIQITIPLYFFWTNTPNVWIEIESYPYTTINNNFIAVPAWFNISTWTRPLNFAFDVVDHDKPVIIKRGDPLYQITFNTENLDNRIKLIKKDLTEEVYKKAIKTTNVKNYVENLSSKLMFQKQKSKCPFSFLWQNDK